MVVKLVGKTLPTSQNVNTDNEVSLPGQDVAIVKLPPDPDKIHVLDAIQYSYKHSSGGGPIQGGITIFKGTKVCWDADIPDFTGVLNFYIPCPNDKELKILLKAGGANVIGKLNVQTHLDFASNDWSSGDVQL